MEQDPFRPAGKFGRFVEGKFGIGAVFRGRARNLIWSRFAAGFTLDHPIRARQIGFAGNANDKRAGGPKIGGGVAEEGLQPWGADEQEGHREAAAVNVAAFVDAGCRFPPSPTPGGVFRVGFAHDTGRDPQRA